MHQFSELPVFFFKEVSGLFLAERCSPPPPQLSLPTYQKRQEECWECRFGCLFWERGRLNGSEEVTSFFKIEKA